MTKLNMLKHDLEHNVKNITVSQPFSDCLKIILEPNSSDGPCLCVNFDELGQIDYIDFSDMVTTNDSLVIDEPYEFTQLQQILSIIYKYLTKK